MIITGGKNIYGCELGILMLESHFPRLVGDVGHAKTYDFPVLFHVVKGSLPKKVVLDLGPEDLEPFIAAAKELERQGVRAITTSCGFLALFQKKLASCLKIPIFTSTLMLLPSLFLAFYGKKILVLTANSKTLTPEHLAAVGVAPEFLGRAFDLVGTEDGEMFTNFTVQDWSYVDPEKCWQEISFCLDRAFQQHDYAAILLECTNLPPYSALIRQRYGKPVFDFVSMVKFFHAALSSQQFAVGESFKDSLPSL